MEQEYSNDSDSALMELDRQARVKMLEENLDYPKAFQLVCGRSDNSDLVLRYLNRNH